MRRERYAAMRDAVLGLERARRADEQAGGAQANAMWRGLALGELCVIDRFERDGRKYVVARRVARRPHVRALSPRERDVVVRIARGCSNKVVAAELGLRVSTVSVYLASATAKLGFASRVELIRAFREDAARMAEVA